LITSLQLLYPVKMWLIFVLAVRRQRVEGKRRRSENRLSSRRLSVQSGRELERHSRHFTVQFAGIACRDKYLPRILLLTLTILWFCVPCFFPIKNCFRVIFSWGFPTNFSLNFAVQQWVT